MEAFNDNDLHFQKFTKSLKKIIDTSSLSGENEDDSIRLQVQKEDIELLVSLEKELKELLVSSGYAQEFYEKFMFFICEIEKNILLARPYFRERQTAFYKGISECFKKKQWEKLLQYHFNYLFISFFETPTNDWEKIPSSLRIIENIKTLRKKMVQKLMPLAISRARIFWSRTPESHLSFMDLLQISAEGLIAAIDKYCLPFTNVFRSVCIGRITGNFIADYSETQLHFYPGDRRKIYRANKITKHLIDGSEEVNYDSLALAVNQSTNGYLLPSPQRTTASEIHNLLAASSCVSADAVFEIPNEDLQEETNSSDKYAAPEETRPDYIAEENEVLQKVLQNTQKLSLIEQKLLIMEGLLSYE